MELKTLFQTLLPVELQPPTHFPRPLLASLGYFRFRTWAAPQGEPLPDPHLYQPLYSPWEGEQAFEGIYRQLQSLTLVSCDRCYILWKTLQQSVHLQGDFVECGVFRGGTALLAARTLHEHMAEERRFHLFDSFEAMPKTTCGVDRFQSGDFSSTSIEAVGNLLAPYSFVKFHRGFIPDTFADLQIDQIAWAHIDVDISQSVHACIRYIYPRLVPGAFLIFDDYGFPSCAGARRAVDEAFTTLLEAPLCLPTGQCLVVK